MTAIKVSNVKKQKKESQLHEFWRRFSRNKLAVIGIIYVLSMVLVAILQYQIAPEGINDQNYERMLLPPSLVNLFGTDQYGRDIFSRMVLGTKYTLTMGLIAASISSGVGIFLGSITGYYGGRLDNFVMRIVDIFMTLPNILLSLVMTASFGPGFANIMIAVGIAGAPSMTRVTRSAVMSVSNQEYIEAAKSNNASDARIIFRYILPNAIAPIIVSFTMYVASAILVGSSLSFLGLGLQPPTPEWGSMLSAGKPYMRDAWWITTIPGIFIMSIVLAVNLIGDGLRDALDPKQNR